MNRFRLRGTWEDDPAPFPFPGALRGAQPGRRAGTEDQPRDIHLADAPSTDALIRNVEAEFERASLKIDDLRDMLTPFDGDLPPAA